MRMARSGWRPRARRHPAVAAPPHIARQIEVASRLAPAEAYQSRSALLLCCRDADPERAEESLRAVGGVDEVHPLRCPIGSWADALEAPRGTESWLRHYVMRAFHRRAPDLLAVLDSSEPRGEPRGQELIAMLRSWGVTCPVAVLRVRASQGAEPSVARSRVRSVEPPASRTG